MLYVQSKHNVRKADGAPFRMETKLHHLIYASEEVAHTINNIVMITQDIAVVNKTFSILCTLYWDFGISKQPLAFFDIIDIILSTI